MRTTRITDCEQNTPKQNRRLQFRSGVFGRRSTVAVFRDENTASTGIVQQVAAPRLLFGNAVTKRAPTVTEGSEFFTR